MLSRAKMRRFALGILASSALLSVHCEKSTPAGKPWCDCAVSLEGAPAHVLVYLEPEDSWGAPYVPQAVRLYVTKGQRRQLALKTEIANDGVVFDEGNVLVAQLGSADIEVRLSGHKQQPACFRVDRSTLELRAKPCLSPPALPVACHLEPRVFSEG